MAITTRFLGPTNVRGSRVKATSDDGTLTLGWDPALNPTQNHVTVARALASKKGWDGKWYSGELPGSGGYVFVRAVGTDKEAAFHVFSGEY